MSVIFIPSVILHRLTRVILCPSSGDVKFLWIFLQCIYTSVCLTGADRKYIGAKRLCIYWRYKSLKLSTRTPVCNVFYLMWRATIPRSCPRKREALTGTNLRGIIWIFKICNKLIFEIFLTVKKYKEEAYKEKLIT